MKYGIEVTVARDAAPELLKRAQRAGLTNDLWFHRRHCECVPHERDENHFHTTWDRGGLDGEFVSRVLDSESSEDTELVRAMEHAVKQGAPRGEVSTHVHVECSPELVVNVVRVVALFQSDLVTTMTRWLGYNPYAHRALRVYEDERTDISRWLSHPTQPPSFDPDYAFHVWVRYTRLGTVELRWWFSESHDPHLVDIVKMSLALVEGAKSLARPASTPLPDDLLSRAAPVR